MKRPITALSALYEEGLARIFEAWEALRHDLMNQKLLRRYILEMRRCETIKVMLAEVIGLQKENEDFDELLPVRTCNLDDDECSSCQ